MSVDPAASDVRAAPRTFATWIRDAVPMDPPVLERLIALDAGRHPTLTAIRLALGANVQFADSPVQPEGAAVDDPSAAALAARELFPARGASTTDADLARLLDALYRSITSTRLVRVEITADGPRATRVDAPVVLRDDDHLHLLVFADNRTDADLQFSAEAHGEGIGGTIEAQRTGSALLDAGAMHPGTYLLPVLTVAAGRASTVDVPVECKPSGVLRVRIIDDATGQRVAARVYLTDDVGASPPGGVHLRLDTHRNAFFHADGEFTARIAGTARLRIVRGIEYEPVETQIAIAPDSEREVEVRLRRWSHMAADGWYSGDVHVHLHYGGEYVLAPEDAALAQRGEDVHFMNMMVANQNTGWVHDGEHFEGVPHALSDGDHILRWGEEYRNDFYGHMCMWGMPELVPPIYSGFLFSEQSYDLPANAVAAKHCHTIGGTLSYAHPMFDAIDLDRVFARRRTVEAKELPVDAALGHIDAIDVMSYPGNELHTSQLWYRLLNCGLRLAATAGTDTFMNYFALGTVGNPPAGDRVFVQVDGALTTESWCAGVRAGRTFVTNGPMISLAVNGAGAGDQLDLKPGDVAHIEAEAGSFVPMERIELVVNGEIVASSEATDAGKHAALSHELRISESAWIAARVTGPAHELVLDPHGLFAHTSPVFVAVEGAPVCRADDAAYFVDWIERLIVMATERGSYPSDAERDAVVAIFREGQAYYRAIVAAAS